MNDFSNKDGQELVEAMITAIQQNSVLLSEIDGAIGDGDHGINMNKGFTLCAERLVGKDWDLTEGLSELSTVLLEEIGGAMGPLYGSFFRAMSRATKGKERIDAAVFETMLEKALEVVVDLGGAQVGDKTLVDALAPAVEAFKTSLSQSPSFSTALEQMSAAAERGKDSTKDLVAKIGRSSRLGERSRGVLDAGSVSCWLLLRALAQASQKLLQEK